METKQLGTQHGAAVRSKVGNAALFARDVAVDTAKLTWLGARYVAARTVEIAVPAAKGAEHKAKRAGAYVAGFAQGLVRSGNA